MKFIDKLVAFMTALYAYMTSNEKLGNAIYDKLKHLYKSFAEYKSTVSERFTTVDNAITGAVKAASDYTDAEIAKLNTAIRSGFNGFRKFQITAGEVFDLTKAINNKELTLKEGQWRFDFTILDAEGKPTPLGEAEMSIEDNGTQVLHKVSSDEKLIVEVNDKGVITVIGIDDNEVDLLAAKVEETGAKYDEMASEVNRQKNVLETLKGKFDALTV